MNISLMCRMSSGGYSVAQRKDAHLTRIVLITVLVFLLINMPRLLMGVWEMSRYSFRFGQLLQGLDHLVHCISLYASVTV